MQNHWIIDVLSDLRSFARLNGMAALDSQLQQTLDVASRSIAETGGSVRKAGSEATGHFTG